jgi:hypothetical protein
MARRSSSASPPLNRLLAFPPLQIRMHHLPDDGSRPDDGDLDHEIVEARRLQPRQRRHLRPRLDLEHADRVRLLQHPIDAGIVGHEMCEIDGRRRGARLRDPGSGSVFSRQSSVFSLRSSVFDKSSCSISDLRLPTSDL